MISFVWSAKYPFLVGAGGSESYTAGQIRELTRRGIPCRIITVGFGENDGREGFPDITFTAIDDIQELSTLDDTIVFITYPRKVRTKHPAYVILHCPPLSAGRKDPLFDYSAMHDKRLIVPSKFAGKLWAKQLKWGPMRMPTVYPFAEEAFSQVQRPVKKHQTTRILYANRLTPDKGIYTLLASLHLDALKDLPYDLTVTAAGAHTEEGHIIHEILKAHPKVNVVPAYRSAEEAAKLMAEHDIVVMPSTDLFWKEIFGISSVEAQHAGCRVVGSKAGGLPETNCGGLVLARPDNPLSLAQNIVKAVELGPLTEYQRAQAQKKFTVAESVDALLRVIWGLPQAEQPRVGPIRLGQLPQLTAFGDRLIRSAYEGVRPGNSSLSARKS